MSDNRTHYIDENTRIRYRYTASLLGYGHTLERRCSWWVFDWWTEVAAIYESVVSGRDIKRLVEVLLYMEKQSIENKQMRKNGFSGYPTSRP